MLNKNVTVHTYFSLQNKEIFVMLHVIERDHDISILILNAIRSHSLSNTGGSATGYWDGGPGGALGYRNNIVVVPGTSYTVVVGAGGVRIFLAMPYFSCHLNFLFIHRLSIHSFSL